MLMRLFDTQDYDRSLRRRRLMGLGLLAVGIIGLACYILLVRDSEVLSDHARGFYLGAASGICLGALILVIRTQYLLTNPEARKKAKIQEQDEREKAILNQSFMFAGVFTFFAAAASMFVLVAVSIDAARAILIVVIVYDAAFLLSKSYLSKKL